MRQTFSGPAVADCLPISYVLRIGSGSKSHGVVLLPLDFANMMSQPVSRKLRGWNQRRLRPFIICQTEITSTALFYRFRAFGEERDWAEGRTAKYRCNIGKAISMFAYVIMEHAAT